MRNELGFPEGGLVYPKKLTEERARLLAEFQAEKAAPNTRKKLALIAEAMMLFSAQLAIEAALKLNAMKMVVASREKQAARLLHD